MIILRIYRGCYPRLISVNPPGCGWRSQNNAWVRRRNLKPIGVPGPSGTELASRQPGLEQCPERRGGVVKRGTAISRLDTTAISLTTCRAVALREGGPARHNF